MKKTFADLPGWEFEMDEISAGVYEVVGRNEKGMIVSERGIDLNAAIENCRQRARHEGGAA